MRQSLFIESTILLFLISFPACKSTTGPEDYYVAEVRHHVRAAWSPDGRTIAFSAVINNIQGIYLIDSSGTNLRLLVSGDAIGAAWSPDSLWVAFSAGGRIYRVNINTFQIDTITRVSPSIRPRWSGDGTRIAFVRSTEIFVMNLATGMETNLHLTADFPSWHPNGVEVIAQESNRAAGLYRFTAVNDSTGGFRNVHEFTSGDDCGFSSLSPDGKAIVYARKPEREYTQVWKINLLTGEHTQLTTDSGDYPAWSPDGSKIVYTRTVLGDGGLWIMNADGTQKRRLTFPTQI